MTFSKKLRIGLVVLAGSATLLAWTGAGAAYFLDAPRAVFVVALIAAALATEALFWLTMFVLGWTAFANRHWLVRLFTGARKPGEAHQA
ncbi:hypothetical protein X907_2291 [Glycocaulis alkaliphilus]|uniref:Uncharacterized protein n=1 Tax=Glycocaulis alkaliphilus TaxID=1434191 RepID=A0A3T0EBZ8_9PROT|nr:hypothetical protein [Glycocaulis alkaliphilus]AZU04806.1 hypothetical protein X907_2291 [Glycocaulis alkaliphilus]GGB67527.1 hypothetical protein GCM10007417_04170 [Glycocaulis alkaliphilus]